MAESVKAGTHLESWMERIPDRRSCNTETVNAKQNADNWMESKLIFDNLREQVE